MSSSLESGSPPTRNVTGRVAKLSAARIHRACASSARSVVKRPPVAARGAAERVAAPRPDPGPQGPPGRGGDHGPGGAAGEPGWIGGEPRAGVGERLAQQIAAEARLGGRGEILWLDRRDLVEPARGERQVGGAVGGPPPGGPLRPGAPPPPPPPGRPPPPRRPLSRRGAGPPPR